MVLRIDLGGPALELIPVRNRKGDPEYAAEIDGRRVPIRHRSESHDRGYNGRDPVIKRWREAPTMVLFELGWIQDVKPTRKGDTFVFDVSHEQHYRSWSKRHVEITFRDGVVVIEAEEEYQDESYY